MLRIAIVEDEEACVRQMEEYLDRFGKETGIMFQKRIFRNGAQLVFDYRPEYDILLMDIEMPKLNGMQVGVSPGETVDCGH